MGARKGAQKQTMPGRSRRALEGILVGLGAPVGWLVYRVLFEDAVFPGEILASLDLYLYMTIGTCIFFALFAIRLGHFERRLHRSNADLSVLALTDPLTGLRNSRAFRAVLDEAWAHAQNDDAPLSLVVFDLDHFKRINDEHGHPVGDQVLVEVAGRLRRTVREEDCAARVGGEEFAVLMPDTDDDVAREVAERVRREMEEPLRHELIVTISGGVAQARPAMETTHEFYARADASLYEAKASGRNRIVMSRTVPDTSASPQAPRAEAP